MSAALTTSHIFRFLPRYSVSRPLTPSARCRPDVRNARTTRPPRPILTDLMMVVITGENNCPGTGAGFRRLDGSIQAVVRVMDTGD